LSAATETPMGWIRPVSVLDFKGGAPSAHWALVTVLQPHGAGTPAIGSASVQRSDQELIVTVDADRVRFERTDDGWRMRTVSSR
jgi:acid phosphatase family membrane protein YuiD